MAKYEHLKIFKKAYDTTIYFENIVRRFSRYNKYTLGTELRNNSREILNLIVTANNNKNKKDYLLKIREKLEQQKITLRICKEVKAFNNFNSYEFSIKETIDLLRQNEGWLRSCK